VPEVGEVTGRRYRCRACGAVVMVVPRGVAPRLRYRLGAVVGALGLWCHGHSAAEVRRRVSPFRVVGEEARRGWRSLRRWTRRLAAGLGQSIVGRARDHVEAVLQRLAAASAMSTGVLLVDALAGAAQLDAHRLCVAGGEAPTI